MYLCFVGLSDTIIRMRWDEAIDGDDVIRDDNDDGAAICNGNDDGGELS